MVLPVPTFVTISDDGPRWWGPVTRHGSNGASETGSRRPGCAKDAHGCIVAASWLAGRSSLQGTQSLSRGGIAQRKCRGVKPLCLLNVRAYAAHTPGCKHVGIIGLSQCEEHQA